MTAEIHHTHRNVTGGWLRPAVFGAMDGLVSNLALIVGVAGGGATPTTVALAGMAGLAAGAFSMAAGEYTSVASQAELALAEIEVERREITHRPTDEQAELAQLFRARGVDEDLAREVARQISQNPDQALIVHTREELGVDPTNLPSPLVAAGSSFLSFALGALVPVLPYLFGANEVWPAAIIALTGLFACGSLVGKITAKPWWYSGLRQLMLGAAAAAATYGFGWLVGAGLN
jgi:VIT1/CCC1 family predicted Fe2+/Mn2+ transporter